MSHLSRFHLMTETRPLARVTQATGRPTPRFHRISEGHSTLPPTPLRALTMRSTGPTSRLSGRRRQERHAWRSMGLCRLKLISLRFTGRRRVLFARDLPAGAHTFSLTVISGVVGIDGIVVRADELAAARGAVTPGRMETEIGATPLTGLPDDDGLDCTVAARRGSALCGSCRREASVSAI